MVADFLHGVEVKTDTLIQPVANVDMSTIGIIGTAPLADPEKWPLNTPVLVSGNDTTLIGALVASPQDGKDTGTLSSAFSSILDETSPVIVAIRVAAAGDETKTIANIVGGLTADGNYTGVHAFLAAESVVGRKPRLLCAPGFTHQTTKGALTAVAIDKAGSGYTQGRYSLKITDASGSGASAEVVIDDNGAVSNVVITANGSGYSKPSFTFPSAAGSGSGASLKAEITDLDNPVIAELKPIAERLRAVIFADGPNSGTEQAINATRAGGNRVMLIDPWVVKEIDGVSQTIPASSKFASKQAWVDQHLGFWRSVSNQTLSGITATSRPIDFSLGDESCVANVLNASNVTTIIRRSGVGFVTWGNRALDSSFLCVQRTIDNIADAVQNAVLQFVDMGICKSFLTEVTSEVSSYLRQLQSEGAITGGKCWADDTKNTANAVKNGEVFFDFDIGPVYPAERIRFTMSVNDGYVTDIFGGSDNG